MKKWLEKLKSQTIYTNCSILFWLLLIVTHVLTLHSGKLNGISRLSDHIAVCRRGRRWKERSLTLPQPIMPDFVDSSWEPLAVRRSGPGGGWQGGEEEQEESWERKLWLECKMKIKRINCFSKREKSLNLISGTPGISTNILLITQGMALRLFPALFHWHFWKNLEFSSFEIWNF